MYKIFQLTQQNRHLWGAGAVICLLAAALVLIFFAPNLGVRGEYYPNTQWAGSPLRTIDRAPYLRGNDGAELLFTNTYSVKWSTWIFIEHKGRYRFATNSDDGSVLRLDGKTLVDNGGVHGLKKVSADISLERGSYPIEISYFQAGGDSVMDLFWTPPNQKEERMPTDEFFLTPPVRVVIFLRNFRRLLLSVPIIFWGLAGLGLLSIFLLKNNGERHQKLGKLALVMAVGLGLLPLLYLISFLPSLHQIPNNDYWGSFGHLLRDGRFNGLFGKQNEHIVVIPNLIYFLNYSLTKGNNQGLFVWNLLIVAATLLFTLKIIKAHSPFTQRNLLLLAPLLSCFFFAPIQAHNFILSMSGTCWFPTNFFLVASLYYMFHQFPQETFFSIGLASSLALCGVFSYSTGIFIFSSSLIFLFLYSLIFRKGLRFSGTYLLLFTLYAVWRFKVDPPVQKPASKFHLFDAFEFAVMTIGNPFSTKRDTVLLWGIAGLTLSLVIGAFIVYKAFYKRDESFFLHIAPWMIYTIYGLTNMLAASMVRNNPRALRYTNISMIFWVGLFMSIIILLKYTLPLLASGFSVLYPMVPALALGFLLLVPIYQHGTEKMRHLHQVFRDQEFAALALQLHIYDNTVLNKISIAPGQVTQQIPLIKQTGHVPFHKNLIPGYNYDTPIDLTRVVQEHCYGRFERLSQQRNDVFQARGWINCADSQEQVKYLILVDEQGRIKGAGIPLPPKIPQGTRIEQPSQTSYFGWKGLASLTQEALSLSAYAVLQDNRLIALEQQQKVQHIDD